MDTSNLFVLSEGAIVASALAHTQTASIADAEFLKDSTSRRMNRWTLVVYILGSTSILSALLAMMLHRTALIYFAFFATLITAPAVLIQRRRLNRLPTLVQEINLCRQLVNRFHLQNDRLERETNRMQNQVSKLQEKEETLHQVAAEQGMAVHELESLVHEHGATVKQMKQMQEAAQLQEILYAVLVSDTDQDQKLSEKELERLEMRLRVFRRGNQPLDDGLIRQAFHLAGASSVSTTTLYRQTRQLMAKHKVEEETEESGDVFAWGYRQCID